MTCGSVASGCLYYSECKTCLAATKEVLIMNMKYTQFYIRGVSFRVPSLEKKRQQLIFHNDFWHEN